MKALLGFGLYAAIQILPICHRASQIYAGKVGALGVGFRGSGLTSWHHGKKLAQTL